MFNAFKSKGGFKSHHLELKLFFSTSYSCALQGFKSHHLELKHNTVVELVYGFIV